MSPSASTPRRVLEVGVGHGRTLAQVAELAPKGFIAGIDISSEMVQMAHRHNRDAREPMMPLTAGFRMSCGKRNYGFGRTVDAPVWSRAAVTACQTIESPLKHSTHHGLALRAFDPNN